MGEVAAQRPERGRRQRRAPLIVFEGGAIPLRPGFTEPPLPRFMEARKGAPLAPPHASRYLRNGQGRGGNP
ncbi:hypothetical protein MPL3365_70507 [Mesorhizobium plurifarium]|uniref:Uncharacterized protein n=1 Tax=Mesorhizobium plurifarium TaxID=69974 RepID=A0A090GHG8_MESPL|nr:hypothetical protein MPL3365_70507 [Mesorhizobium plurifarium]